MHIELVQIGNSLLPGEDVRRHHAFKSNPAQGADEGIPIHFTLTDIKMLMDAGQRSRRVEQVSLSRERPGSNCVNDGYGREARTGLLHDSGGIAAHVVRMWNAITKGH